MARALWLTPTALEPPALLGTGPFGARVISLLGAEHADCREYKITEAEITSAFAGTASALVIALWRPEPDLCEIADNLSFRFRRPWLPVVMEHPLIRVGPVVCPPAGPCFRCYARRRSQHDAQPWATAALQSAYDHDQTCGPGGYLPHHARLAAATVNQLLRQLSADSVSDQAHHVAGDVITIRLADTALRVSRVVAWDNCDRCNVSRSPDAADWLANLATSLRGGPARAIPEGRGAVVLSNAESEAVR